MLERASTCLESGGRQLLRAPKQCLRTRRLLHSNFWHNGASDLSPPYWWAATSTLGPGSGDINERLARPVSESPKQHDGALLDFLYPEKTLALLKRLSVSGPNSPQPRRRQSRAVGVRRFSTISPQSWQDEPNADAAIEEQAKVELGSLLQNSTALVELQKLLRAREPGKQELAWQLYSAIPEDELDSTDHRLRNDLLKYLTRDGSPAFPGRVLQLFNELPVDARQPSSYRAAVVAYIALRMVGPAIQLLEEIHVDKDSNIWDVGTDIILRRTVFDEQWDLSLRVFKTFLRHVPTLRGVPTTLRIRHGNTLPELWKEVTQLPGLLDTLQSFLNHVREYQHELRSSKEQEQTLACFVMTFVPNIMDSVLHAHISDEAFIQNWFRELFDDLQTLGLPMSACYEYAIKRMLQMARYQNSSNKPWLKLYHSYRFRYLNHPDTATRPEPIIQPETTLQPEEEPEAAPHPEESPQPDTKLRPDENSQSETLLKPDSNPQSDLAAQLDATLQLDSITEARPSQMLIRQLIFRSGFDNDRKLLQRFVQDLRTFYPDEPFSPGLLKFLIQTSANHGDERLVHEYVNEIQESSNERVDLNVLSSLLFVYARRADVAGTIRQFRRIRDEFDMTPDIVCWNILLLAHIRADDIDGALECFDNSVDSGMKPNIQTFGPLLDFCASRGDVEAFEALFSRARQMGVPIDSDVRARSGYVQAFLNSGDIKSAEAVAQGMLESWQVGTLNSHPLTHTWNLLIQYHALNRDIARSRECYRQMVENKIPLDSWTYGSLMRALVEVKQTGAAYKILRGTMPAKQLRVHALHYAIVITGYLKEGQIDEAMEAYERMLKHNVPHTESSRQASMLTVGAIELKKLKQRKAKHPNYRLLEVEKALQEVLVAGAASEIAHREPRLLTQVDLRSPSAVSQAYYGLLISLYSSRGAYAICKKLFKKAMEAAPEADDYNTSITLTTAIMEAHLKAGKYEEVAKCWELARSSAEKLAKTFHDAAHPQPVIPEFDSLIDPTVRERFEHSNVSSNRRHVLFKASRVYIRSLLAQSGANVLQEAQRTIRDLLVNGFAVDNLTWNEFIQQLALRHRLVDAFTICEEYLMPSFPGWRKLAPNYKRNNIRGYPWMDIRHYEVKKFSVMPRYKTLVILAKAYGQIKRDERNGVGYDLSAGAWKREILEQGSPMTVRAIETMPRTHDWVQEKYFHNN